MNETDIQNKIQNLPEDLKAEVLDYIEFLLNNHIGNLDFDDAYQYCVANYYGLKIVTMDKDFNKINNENVIFM